MMSQSITSNSDTAVAGDKIVQSAGKSAADGSVIKNTPTTALEATGENNSDWTRSRIVMWIVAAFGLLFLITMLVVAPQIQQRLDRQAMDRLQQAGINSATLKLDWEYRNLTVSGYLPADVSPAQLAMVLRGTTEQPSAFFAEGIRHLRLNLDQRMSVANAVRQEKLFVEVNSDGSTTTLSGVVQNNVQRKALVDAVLLSGVDSVNDNLDVQSVAGSSSVQTRVAALSKLLQELKPEETALSEISLTEDELNYRVTVRDKSSAGAIEQAATVDIANFSVTGGVQLLSPEMLNVLVESNGDQIMLSGTIYSDAHRKRLVFAASEAVSNANVVDNLTLSERTSEAPELMAQVDGMAAVISRFAPGITGQIALQDGELVVGANTGSEEVRDYLAEGTASARNAGLSVVDNIRVLVQQQDSQALQGALNELVTEVRRTVVFDSGASDLSSAAKRTLDKVAQQIGNYSGLVVEIEGHTDNVGRANVNEQLSQSRANSVRQYLASRLNDLAAGNAGTQAIAQPISQLIAVGYGHRRPLETNDTAEGRQANRRVHFTVLRQDASVQAIKK